jgi:phage terminase large subunit
MPIQEVRSEIPYKPRSWFVSFHDRTQRFAIGVAHRRCGKTVACVNDMIRRAATSPLTFYKAAYIAPYLRQAKDVSWTYFKHYAAPLIARVNESELWIELVNGARIRIYGADNADALRGGYLDDVVLDEYADMDPSVWGSVIRPMLADRAGTVTFIGTPKGRNNFFEMWQRAKEDPKWFSFLWRASETGILPESELDLARGDMTSEQYEQEFECSFEAAILGAYYGREMAECERSGRIRLDLQPVANVPINTAWDFGNGSNMAVWVFQVGTDHNGRSQLLIHDFIQCANWYFDDYLGEVNKRGYSGSDYVPHDARVPSFETGRTRIETMVAAGRRPVLVSDHHVDDGINATKLAFPRMIFNGTNCKIGIEALRQYRAEWDEKARVFRTVPRHDWASHPADALRYLAMAWREIIAPKNDPPAPLFKPLGDLTFDEFFEVEEALPTTRI